MARANIIKFLLSHDFQISFWSSILSGLIVSGIIGFIVYQYTNIFKLPELGFVVKQNGFYRNKILLTKNIKGGYEASFQFAIKNSGNKTIEPGEGYWHLYLDTTSNIVFSDPGEPNHKRDIIQAPIYPDSFFDLNLVYKLDIKKEDLDKKKIPYFFQTIYGNYPKSVKMNSDTGQVLFKDMNFIQYELPKE
jgi:hypothetical protein